MRAVHVGIIYSVRNHPQILYVSTELTIEESYVSRKKKRNGWGYSARSCLARSQGEGATAFTYAAAVGITIVQRHIGTGITGSPTDKSSLTGPDRMAVTGLTRSPILRDGRK